MDYDESGRHEQRGLRGLDGATTPHSRILPNGGVPHQDNLPPEVDDLNERQEPEGTTGEHQVPTDDELLEDQPRDSLKRPAPPSNAMDEEMIPEHDELDLDRLMNDPSYLPLGPLPPAPPHTSTAESSGFQAMRAAHEQQDRPHHVIRQEHLDQAFMASSPGERVYAVTIPAPRDASEWRKMVKDPSEFVAKTMQKGVEVQWGRLTDQQRDAMQEAKNLEVQQWLRTKVAKKVSERVDPASLIGMRWVLTFKAAEADKDGNTHRCSRI